MHYPNPGTGVRLGADSSHTCHPKVQALKRKYIVLTTPTSGELEMLVSQRMAMGFVPLGGVAVDSRDGLSLYQAMVLPEEKGKK